MEATRKSTEPAPPPPPASAALIASVLGDDDLLREILLRLGFPTCLVRAAAVSKRWLRHASDPAFLRRFRARHPSPRPLGSYVLTEGRPLLRFIPMQQATELAAVIRRCSFELGRNVGSVSDSRNGRLIVIVGGQFAVSNPLHPERGTTVLPQLPIAPDTAHGDLTLYSQEVLFNEEDGGDGISCTRVTLMRGEQRALIQFSDLQAGAWGESRTSDLIKLPEQWRRCQKGRLLAYNKLYVICMAGYILGLDLQSSRSFCIKFPDGVQYEYDSNIRLSRVESSEFCLIHVKEFRMHVWFHNADHNNTGTWKLVDTICLRQAFGHLADPTWQSRGAIVHVAAVGDNADFVFLRIQHKLF